MRKLDDDARFIPHYLNLFVCTVGNYSSDSTAGCATASLFRRVSVSVHNASSQQSMPRRAADQAEHARGLGFKCIICSSEFESRRGADCRRRHLTSIGTACADPRSIQSLSLSARQDATSGILRQHSAAPLRECV